MVKNNYWSKFYKKKHTMNPSPFAEEIASKIPRWTEAKVIDLLAGNGRDSKYFTENGIECIGIDNAFENSFVRKFELDEVLKVECIWDLVYSRFGIHCLPLSKVKRIINWANGKIALEWRAPGDKPIIFKEKKGHYREYHKPEIIVKYLLKAGFNNIDIKCGYGLAKFKKNNKTEDPMVCRIYATKN